jgi:hypothetical protein
MKLIKLLADINQPFDIKSGTILVSENFVGKENYYRCHVRNARFNISTNDADELSKEEYLDIVEHINKL